MSSDVSLNFCVLAGWCLDCGAGWFVVFCGLSGVAWARVVCVWSLVCFGWGLGVCGVCGCDVVETSYEGHMVDALASRADEGRWSLR